MEYIYNTQGVCSRQIRFELDGNIVKNVSFVGGCNGNLKAISKLVEGMNAEQVIEKLKDNTCGFKSTSCADQLAVALRSALEEQK